MRILLTSTMLAATLALGGAAFAQAPAGAQGTQGQSATGQSQAGQSGATGADGISRSPTQGNPMQSGALNTQEQVRGKLAAEGFTDIQAITRSGNSFQARAMQNGRPVDLTIDATTGTIRSQAAAR